MDIGKLIAQSEAALESKSLLDIAYALAASYSSMMDTVSILDMKKEPDKRLNEMNLQLYQLRINPEKKEEIIQEHIALLKKIESDYKKEEKEGAA